MIKTAIIVLSSFITSCAARAALIDSEWGPLRSWGQEQLTFQGGRLHFTSSYPLPKPPEQFYFYGEAARTWQGGYVTLAEDWSVQLKVHTSDFDHEPGDYVDIGIFVAKANEPVLDQFHRLANVNVRYSGPSQRFAFPTYGLGALAESDAVIAISYSASEKVLDSYVRALHGRFEKFSSISIERWFSTGTITPDEPLEISIFGASKSTQGEFTIGTGVVYADSFSMNRHALIVPESGVAIMLPILTLAMAKRGHAFKAAPKPRLSPLRGRQSHSHVA